MIGLQTQPAPLTIFPERWETAEVFRNKTPSDMLHTHIAQGPVHSQNGAVKVDSSEGEPARKQCVNPKSSCLTPDRTNHLGLTGGLARKGETARFGKPTNDMLSLEASTCTLRHHGEPSTESLIFHAVDVMARSIMRQTSYHVDVACLSGPIFTLRDRRCCQHMPSSHFALSSHLHEDPHSFWWL